MRSTWVCQHLPNPFSTYLSDVDETREDGSIVCQNLAGIEHTLRDGYALVRATAWLAKNFPRVP